MGGRCRCPEDSVTESALQSMLPWGMGICALMVLVWLARIGSKGATAYLMAVAFAAFGGVMAAMLYGWPLWTRYVLGFVVLACLLADFANRAANQQRGQS